MKAQNQDPQDAPQVHRAPRRAVAPGPLKAAPPAALPKSHDRHAAITANLHSWSDYQKWARTIRSAWRSAE